MLKRIGLPATLKMRHDAHYVESLTSYSGAAVGRMIPVDQIRPNPDQPRKALGDLRELTRLDPREGRAGAAAGAVYCAGGLLLHYFGRAAAITLHARRDCVKCRALRKPRMMPRRWKLG